MANLNIINDRELLSSIADYKVLTVKQLSIVSQRSAQVVRRRMRILARDGVIATRMEGYGGGRGRPEDLLFLTERGAALLEENGVRNAASAADKTGDRFFIDHLLLLNGFRLLFLTNSNARLVSLCRLVRKMPPSDFIWLVDQERMFSHGLSARIWARGGRNDNPPQSILGSVLACDLPVIDIK